MNKDWLRVKVAELCPNIIRYLEVQGCPGGLWQFWDGEYWRECVNNDLLRDLNACAGFEKTLSEEQQYEYIETLARLNSYQLGGRIWRICHASPEQRCRAFISTMEGKS